MKFLENILNDADFQQDPIAYLEAWKKKRGESGWRSIEDAAYLFLKNSLVNHK